MNVFLLNLRYKNYFLICLISLIHLLKCLEDSVTDIYDEGANVTVKIKLKTNKESYCTFSGIKLVEMNFTRDIKITIESNSINIIIPHVKQNNSGIYACYGESSFKGKHIFVQGPPAIKINNKIMTHLKEIFPNEPVIIECIRNGSIKTDLKITLNNTILTGMVRTESYNHIVNLTTVIKRTVYTFTEENIQMLLKCEATVGNVGSYFHQEVMLKINKFNPCKNDIKKYIFSAGDSVKLSCLLDSNKKNSQYFWQVKNKNVSSLPTYEIPLNKSDTYTCHRNCDNCQNETCIYKIIYSTMPEPEYINCLNDRKDYWASDEIINLSCSVNSSSPISSYNWYSTTNASFSENSEIIQIKAEDNMEVICLAVNQQNISIKCTYFVYIKQSILGMMLPVVGGLSSIIILVIICYLLVGRRHKQVFNIRNPRRLYNSVAYYFSYRKDSERNFVEHLPENVLNIPIFEVTNIILQDVGYFGPVYRGMTKLSKRKSTQNATVVIVKIPEDKLDFDVKERFITQIDLHYHLLSHCNVISCFGRTYINGELGSVLEYAAQGSLKNYLQTMYHFYFNSNEKQHKKTISDLNCQIIKFCKEISSGMVHLSRNNIVHMNLSAKNVLLGENYVCKISDFSLHYVISTAETCKRYYEPIPVRWMAPESIFYNTFNTNSDVWSFGIVLWEIITLGFTPYYEFKSGIAVKNALQIKYRMTIPDHCQEELKHLIECCWSELSLNRPSFDQINLKLGTFQDKYSIVDFEKFQFSAYENADLNVYREVII